MNSIIHHTSGVFPLHVMKKIFITAPFVLLLAACAPEEKEVIVTYDQDSWKEIIEDSCTSYFDGCNNCMRGSGDSNLSACTRKFCQHYEKPRCLDEES